MEHILPEEQLIEYVKPYLKAKDLRKRTNVGQKIQVNLPSVFISKEVLIQKKIIISVREYSLMS